VEIGRYLFPGKIVRILEPKITLESISSKIKILQKKVFLLNSKATLQRKEAAFI